MLARSILPPKKLKPAKRSTRWRSQAHLNHVRSFACAVCWSDVNIEAAHVRMGSGAGLGQKPDDFRAVPLCGHGGGKDGGEGCHARQHRFGEPTFWSTAGFGGMDPEALIADLIRTSPRRREIEAVKRERSDG